MVAGSTGAPHKVPVSPPMRGGQYPHEESRSPPQNERAGAGMMPSFMGFVTPFMSCWQPDVNSCVAPSMRMRTGPPGPPPPSSQHRDIPSPLASPLVERHHSYQQQKQHDQSQQTTNIRTPHSNDVLCGRGGSSNRHVGNTNFRGLVAANKEMYVTLTKKQKMMVAREIVKTVHNQDPPGRFLQKDAETSLWFDIGLPRSLEKTSQALREKGSGDKIAASQQDREETTSDISAGVSSVSAASSTPSSPQGSSTPGSPRSPSISVSSSKKKANAKPPPITIPPHLEAQFRPRSKMRFRHVPHSPAYGEYGPPPPPPPPPRLPHMQQYPGPSPHPDSGYRIGSPSPPHVPSYPYPHSPGSHPPPPSHGMPPHRKSYPPSPIVPPSYPPHSSGPHPPSPSTPRTPHHGIQGTPRGPPPQQARGPVYSPSIRSHLAYPSFSSSPSSSRKVYSPGSATSPIRRQYPRMPSPAHSGSRMSPQFTRQFSGASHTDSPASFSASPAKSGHAVSPPPRDSISPGRQQVHKKQRTKSLSPKRPSIESDQLGRQGSTHSLTREMQQRLSLQEDNKEATTSQSVAITPPSTMLQSRSRRTVAESDSESDKLSGLAALAGAALLKLDQPEKQGL